MARRNKNNGKPKPEQGRDNYQDNFSAAEYDKGYRAGEGRGKMKENPTPKMRQEGKVSIKTGSRPNDTEWYIPNDQLAKDVAQASMYTANGRPVLQNFTTNTSDDPVYMNRTPVATPGIMALRTMITWGDGNTLNTAGKLLYSWLQQKTGRTPAYDHTDLLMYLVAMDSAYSCYAWMARLYGIINKYSLTDRYTPDALILANGVNPSSLRASLADFRMAINNYAFKLASLPMPIVFAFTKKHTFQFQSVYTDADTRKAQYYMFVPTGFYQWVEGSSGQATHCDFITVPNIDPSDTVPTTSGLTLTQLLTYANRFIDPLLNSQDIRTMASDIMNQFGNDLYEVSPIAETFMITPEYSQEIMEQIENAFIYDVYVNDADIPPTTATLLPSAASVDPYLECTYYGVSRTAYVCGSYVSKWSDAKATPGDSLFLDEVLVNFHRDAVDYKDILSATRYSGCGFRWAGKKTGQQAAATFDGFLAGVFDIIADAYIYTMGVGNPAPLVVNRIATYNVSQPEESLSPASLNNMLGGMAQISKFDWHPMIKPVLIYSNNTLSTTGVNQYDGFIDIDNYAIVPREQLNNINDIAQEGAFFPAGLGGFSPRK